MVMKKKLPFQKQKGAPHGKAQTRGRSKPKSPYGGSNQGGGSIGGGSAGG